MARWEAFSSVLPSGQATFPKGEGYEELSSFPRTKTFPHPGPGRAQRNGSAGAPFGRKKGLACFALPYTLTNS